MGSALRLVDTVTFPLPTGAVVNMMPIIMGDPSTLPMALRGYLPIIEATGLEHGTTVYLTVNEGPVSAGETQRRPGIHTEGTALYCWGGGGWGGGLAVPTPSSFGGGTSFGGGKPTSTPKPAKGIYMASTDGRCRAWDEVRFDVDRHGGLSAKPSGDGVEMVPNGLYWLTDRTPHEALPAKDTGYRQFFRLVADEVGVWWSRHSTENPLGVQPGCRVEHGSKF